MTHLNPLGLIYFMSWFWINMKTNLCFVVIWIWILACHVRLCVHFFIHVVLFISIMLGVDLIAHWPNKSFSWNSKWALLPISMWCKIVFNKNDVIESHLCAWFIFGLFACVWSKKCSHDVGFNVWPYIQEFVYCEQLHGKKIITITIIRNDSKTLIPFLCSSY
jgi:hypothetical protein